MSLYNKLAPVFLFLLPALTFSQICFSQTIVSQIDDTEKNFLVRTKQFNEFIARFNYLTDFSGSPVDSVFTSKFSRKKMISSLFDLNDKRLNSSEKSYSENFISMKEELINDVISNNLLIDKNSGNIIAEAKSSVIFNGDRTTISIFLTQEMVGEDMIKWVIDDVIGNPFNFLKNDSTLLRFIPPSSNETDFINLKRALEDTDYLQYYGPKNYNPDYLTVFFYMVHSGDLKFEYVEEVTYHILNIPGWCLKVKEFNRNEMNSGWLISDISRQNLTNPEYLKRLRK